MATTEELASVWRRAARTLTATRSIRDLDQTLTEIVAAAVETVPGVDAGGISMTKNGEVSSRNPTTAGVTQLDTLQASCTKARASPSSTNRPNRDTSSSVTTSRAGIA